MEIHILQFGLEFRPILMFINSYFWIKLDWQVIENKWNLSKIIPSNSLSWQEQAGLSRDIKSNNTFILGFGTSWLNLKY